MTIAIGKILLAGLLLSTGVFAGPGSVDHRPQKRAGQAALGQEFKIAYGQSVTVEGQDLTVTFDGPIEDSRCPTGVNCVWEGDAKIRIGAREAKGQPVKLELHTSGRFDQAVEYREYVIRLVALDPHPKADVQTRQNDYVATLMVTKAP